MRDPQHPEAIEDAVMRDALLYVAGELNPDAAAAFEQQLAEQQSAREALAQAVQLTLLAVGNAPLQPNPEYRKVVRDRLMHPKPFAWLVQRRIYVGHPAVWTGVGALAMAVFLVLPGWRTELPPETQAEPLQVHAAPETQLVQEPPAQPGSPWKVPDQFQPAVEAVVAGEPDGYDPLNHVAPRSRVANRASEPGPIPVTEPTRVASPTRSR
ncbi:hypothetical protein [Tuwongella immobilis]|uniref:Uncharacterized protein n=1 Tax=Tuwongella immobilis TaxID=692036 RepID=A0A6C2YR52_9BACT|nr:hypothetical protein [Tuwongella immobilis]VIP03583.1 unnamed protein product [Tuwongella immobilis]VTS04534.1 unnamed protein product [Tuwongella immobilis]